MPAIIDQHVCNCAPRCFAIPACPVDAIAFRVDLGQVTIDSDRCGDCPGPCTNFCDRSAIKYTPSYDDFDLLTAQVQGTMTLEEIAAERARRKEAAAKAAEAAKASPVKALTARNFEQVIRTTELPIVIDFWAEWCGPCKQMAPVFEQLARQYEGLMLFAKVDTDREPVLAQQLGIQSLPTLLFIYRGQLLDRVIGAIPPQQLQARIYQVLTVVRQLSGQPPEGADTGPAADKPAGARGQAGGGQARAPGAGGQPPRPARPTIILP
jgi:thioredoxin